MISLKKKKKKPKTIFFNVSVSAMCGLEFRTKFYSLVRATSELEMCLR